MPPVQLLSTATSSHRFSTLIRLKSVATISRYAFTARPASIRQPYLMLSTNVKKRKRDGPHPYLSGNFAPVNQTLPLTVCEYSGTIPKELHGGEYVRNGGNPVSNQDLGRDAHWFDGDGMLSGVAFAETDSGVQPEFVNQYILTDVYLSTIASPYLRRPILPSIATLVNPFSTLYNTMLHIFRTILLVTLSHLPGSSQTINKISVANTGILFHDGRALATCESGPPMRVTLPQLETVGWYNGKLAVGERGGEAGPGFGGRGVLSFMKEWTTAHPRVDLRTGELILFHSTFVPPYVRYSIIPSTRPAVTPTGPLQRPTRLLNAPIPGISSAKMMHDFGISFEHTVIMDLPLSLDPLNLVKGKPVVAYDSTTQSRFGIFPRHSPEKIRWFETSPCCIFHTANTWDENVVDEVSRGSKTVAVNMLACRLTSASLVFSAGNIPPPEPASSSFTNHEEQCRLYYYNFSMENEGNRNDITHQFALSAIPFEFPSTREDRAMSESRYIYGCSTSESTFGTALGRAVKIDCLVKIDASKLIQMGKKNKSLQPVDGCVDQRTVKEVLASVDMDDPIQIFKLPNNFYAQEPRFIPREDSKREDDGWLVTYVFDESQLDEEGGCKPDATSELWIIDARDMKTVACKIQLPMRVPYGLHGTWIHPEQIQNQRPVETIRGIRKYEEQSSGYWKDIRRRLEAWAG